MQLDQWKEGNDSQKTLAHPQSDQKELLNTMDLQ